MGIRFSHWATCALVVTAVVLISEPCWAVFFPLGPSKDEWGLKYNVELTAANAGMVNVAFTLTDEGRLKPVHSYTVVAFSRQTDSQGGRSYDVKSKIELKETPDGRSAGQVQIRKEFVDRAMIRVLTLSVDGRRQTAGAAYYDIPLRQFLNKARVVAAPPTPPTIAAPPTPKIVK